MIQIFKPNLIVEISFLIRETTILKFRFYNNIKCYLCTSTNGMCKCCYIFDFNCEHKKSNINL
jgi:hypothetical protein